MAHWLANRFSTLTGFSVSGNTALTGYISLYKYPLYVRMREVASVHWHNNFLWSSTLLFLGIIVIQFSQLLRMMWVYMLWLHFTTMQEFFQFKPEQTIGFTLESPQFSSPSDMTSIPDLNVRKSASALLISAIFCMPVIPPSQSIYHNGTHFQHQSQ